MSNKVTSREVVKRFATLKSAAFQLAKPSEYNSVREAREVDLHEAAIAYAAAWTKVARADRR